MAAIARTIHRKSERHEVDENMEMVAEAKTLIVERVCDVCKEGKMIPSGGAILFSDPIMYPHICNKCGNTENYKVRYPYYKFVPIEVLREPVGREITV